MTSWLPQWLYWLRQWSCKILNCMLNRLAFCNYALADMKQKWRHHTEKWRHHAPIWRHHASIWRHHDWIWRHHNFLIHFVSDPWFSFSFYFYLHWMESLGDYPLTIFENDLWFFTEKQNRIGWKYFLTGCHDHWLTRFDFFIFAHLKFALLQTSGHKKSYRKSNNSHILHH